jgi:hypothetical protein
MRSWLARRLVVVLAVVAVFALGSSVVLAAIPNTNGSVYACYAKTTGAMRVVNYPTVRCTSSEKMLALTSATVTSRHVAGNFLGSASEVPSITGMFLFEVNAGPTGALQSGWYTTNNTGGPAEWLGSRTQATVDTIRFFTAASGAPAAEFTGWECLLTRAPAGPDPIGTCGHYRIIVTDGASVGLADTFCGGKADVTDPSQPLYCPYVYKIDKGDIRIYSGS